MDVFQHLATVWDLCNIPNFVNHFHESFFIKWEYLLRVFFQLYASRFKQGNLGMESSKWWNQSENSTKIYRLLKVKALYTFVLSPSYVHSVENREIYSQKKKQKTKKEIREINSLVISVVKTLLSRNFKHEIPLVLVLLHITICFFQWVVHFSGDFHLTVTHLIFPTCLKLL